MFSKNFFLIAICVVIAGCSNSNSTTDSGGAQTDSTNPSDSDSETDSLPDKSPAAPQLLPASEVARVLGVNSVQENGRPPFSPGILHNYTIEDKAPLKLLVSNNGSGFDSLKKDYESRNIRELPSLGEKGLAAEYKIPAERPSSRSDERVVIFKKGKFLIELKSISRISDSGHVGTLDELIELAKIIDKNFF